MKKLLFALALVLPLGVRAQTYTYALPQTVNRHMDMVGQGNINRFIELYAQFFFRQFDLYQYPHQSAEFQELGFATCYQNEACDFPPVVIDSVIGSRRRETFLTIIFLKLCFLFWLFLETGTIPSR